MPIVRSGLAVLCFAWLSGCATEEHRAIPTETVAAHATPYSGPVHRIAIGQFENTSPYLRGIFTDGVDRLGGQAKTILKTHLSLSRRFEVLDRDNMDALARESSIAGAPQKLSGAGVVVTGEVTEFGRRETGDHQLFGILGRGKQQMAYSKVSLNVVDVATSRVLCSVQGAGEYELDNREVLGTGGSAGYDSTLNGKVLDLSIREAVDKLVVALERGEWSPAAAAR